MSKITKMRINISRLYCISQGRQRESVSRQFVAPHITQFWRHCLLSGGFGTALVLFLLPDQENENNSFYRVGVEPTTVELKMRMEFCSTFPQEVPIKVI